MKSLFQLLILMILTGAFVHHGLAKGKARGDDICNEPVIEYLKSVGFLPSEANGICYRAKSYMKLKEGRVNKYEALALQIEQMWKMNNPSKPISQGVINHAVRLIRPTVCNQRVARYLKSEGIEIDSIREICDRAEFLVEDSDLTKTEAMAKALREHSVYILKINGETIREVIKLMK